MFCSYENITDYCTNKYSYQYYDVTQSSPVAFATSGDNQSAVIRTDKDTGQQIILTPYSNDFILPCSSDDDTTEATTYWECYQIFLLSPGSVVSPAETSIIQNKQATNINDSFYSSINDGLVVTLDGYNPIVLKTSIQDQIYYGNIAMLASILYTEDTNNPMPAILDVNNVSYVFDYDTLNSILISYFNAFATKKYIKDSVLSKLSSATSVDDINQTYFCPGKIPDSYTTPTIISEIIIKEPPLLPPNESCDPPCDPDSCKSCVDGECIELCAENECCYNGLCIDCLSCEFNVDCNLCDSMYVTRLDNSHELCPGEGCLDCEVLASICSGLGGTYFEMVTNFGLVCNCRDTPSFATSLNNCDHLLTADKIYIGVGYNFESGSAYCCDNQCQIDPC